MRGWLLPLLLVLPALAGCLSDSDSGGDAENDRDTLPAPVRLTIPEDPMPEGAGHDHADPVQHRFLWNYDFSARDPLLQDEANVAGVHALDVQAGHLFGAVYGSHSASVNGGLVIWDLADPANPVETGRWTIPGSVGGDRSMEATPDADYAVISTEPVDCAGHINPAALVAAYLIDTRDKSLPVVADVMTFNRYTAGEAMAGNTPSPTALELGQHSVAVHRIGGEDYAFIWGKIFKIDRSEDDAKLVFVSQINAGHDLYVRDTPWNTTWALASGGSASMVVYDVTDPAAPFEVGYWELSDADREVFPDSYYFHTSDVSFQDGQIVIVETSEDFEDHVSPLWIIDGEALRGVTASPGDPIALNTLGSWSNPGGHPAYAGLTFSLHNPRFHDGGLLTVSSYHGGMWQLDVRHPDFWREPAPIGYAVFADGTPTMMADPVEESVQKNLCGLEIALDAPSYWDVEIGTNGVTYLADGFMGLYTFTPTDSHPAYGAGRSVEYPGTAGL